MTAAEPQAAPASAPAVLRRRLTLFDVLCIGVNAIVGSGVFALPDDMHRAMGGWSPFAYVLCTLLLMPVALAFAELAGMHEETGGAYLYAKNAFGSKVGFVVGWYCWVNTFVSWAAVTTLFVQLVGVRSWLVSKLVVVASIVALGAVNYRGVKPGAFLVNAVTVGKLVAILCFVGVAALAIDPHRFGGALPLGVAGVGQGVYLALFPLQGFEVTPVAAGETTNPKWNVPVATLGSLALSAVLFFVVQGVLVGSYPALAQKSDQPLVDAARFLGPTIGVVVLVGSIVSTGGFSAGSALGSPRYAQAIAAHGLLPRSLARVHPRFETPHVAIVVTTALSAALGACFDYRALVGMSNITVVVQYVATCVAVPVLRRRRPAADRSRIPVIVPWLGAAGSLALLSGANASELLFAGVTLVLGLVAAAYTGRRATAAGAAG